MLSSRRKLKKGIPMMSLYGIRVIDAFFNPTPVPYPSIGRRENRLIKPFPMFGEGMGYVFTPI